MELSETKISQLESFKKLHNIDFDLVSKYKYMLNEPMTLALFLDEKERIDYVDNRLETYDYWKFVI